MSVIALPHAMSFSSFGAEQTSGGSFSTRTLLDGQRYRLLDRRQSYYDCTCYDGRRYDFDGRIITTGGSSGMSATQPMLSQAQVPYYVPLAARRPSNPYRLARVIVNAYTTLLFGETRFPHVRVLGDDDTQEFLQAICRVGRLPIQMIRARNLGGAVGTVGLAWCFKNGKPQFSVHNAKNLFVQEWADREVLVPAHVIECMQFYKDEWDSQRRRVMRNAYWYRRDWTEDEDLVYPELPVRGNEEPNWAMVGPDKARSNAHKDGRIHIAWIQNLPSEAIDGVPDFEGLYPESLEAIDQLYSVIVRGATLNLDPTLKLKLDPDLVRAMGVRKGSDNALIVGKDGDASYLELSGQGIDAGIKLFDSMRRAALEVAQCIVPDPSEVAAQGVSSVAIKAMYAPMVARGEVLQEQYGHVLERILENIAHVGKVASKSRVTVVGPDGDEEEVGLTIDLPPRIENVPVLDEDGKPTGEERVVKKVLVPGEGGEVQTVWPPRFQATPTDLAQIATTMMSATGGKSFLSRQTAVESAAKYFGVDPDEEWKRVERQHAADQEQNESMFAGAQDAAGGRVSGEQDLPDGARARRSFDQPSPQNDLESEEPETA